MRDPFKIDGHTCISFSGGRTSGYMLWRVLQSNGGLPDETVVCFDNTGKEEEATLKFVNDCAVIWDVPIVWLEYANNDKKFSVVSYETASRNGEPFKSLITMRNKLPNPVARWCTGDLKVKVNLRYLKSLGWYELDGWDHLLGIRADEPRRVAKLRGTISADCSKETRWTPLADIGITARDVGKFWENHSFDLGLPNTNGKTMHGNCDLCFLKPTSQLISLIGEKPSRADWWIRMEKHVVDSGEVVRGGGVFRLDRPSYAQMKQQVEQQVDAFGFDPNEETIPCFCGD